MRRRILTFLLIPGLGGFLATILFLMKGGFGGELDLVIGFLELPSSLLILPVGEVLSAPAHFRQPDFLLGIVIPTSLNIGLFVLAAFVSLWWYPPPGIESHPSIANFLLALSCIVLGYTFEAFFGWILLAIYGFASMNPPELSGMQRLRMTLEKMLDPRGSLWGTLFLLIGIIGGMVLIFTGCFRLTLVAGPSEVDRES